MEPAQRLGGPRRSWSSRPFSLLTLALVGAALAGCVPTPGRAETLTLRHIVLLHTTDEHGWMEPYQGYGGASGMWRLWQRREGYRPDGPYLVLSSGDMWTGPAISTTLLGESMVDVMNAMGYRAAALGNHDFDFGQDIIRQRSRQAAFPFLGANIVLRGTDRPSDYVQPNALIDVNGVRVGVSAWRPSKPPPTPAPRTSPISTSAPTARPLSATCPSC